MPVETSKAALILIIKYPPVVAFPQQGDFISCSFMAGRRLSLCLKTIFRALYKFLQFLIFLQGFIVDAKRGGLDVF